MCFLLLYGLWIIARKMQLLTHFRQTETRWLTELVTAIRNYILQMRFFAWFYISPGPLFTGEKSQQMYGASIETKKKLKIKTFEKHKQKDKQLWKEIGKLHHSLFSKWALCIFLKVITDIQDKARITITIAARIMNILYCTSNEEVCFFKRKLQ